VNSKASQINEIASSSAAVFVLFIGCQKVHPSDTRYKTPDTDYQPRDTYLCGLSLGISWDYSSLLYRDLLTYRIQFLYVVASCFLRFSLPKQQIANIERARDTLTIAETSSSNGPYSAAADS